MPRLAFPGGPNPGPAEFSVSQRNLTIALAISVALHALLLSIQFRFPDALSRVKEQALDVILVNSKSARKPPKGQAQAKAQTNLDGGGNTDENRRARTPLPVSAQTRDGNELVDAQRRLAELERQQQQVMTQVKSERQVAADANRVEPSPAAAPHLSGVDLANSARMIARLEGEIARSVDEYNKRPRKKNIGARVEEYRFAQYVEDWRLKVERIGNLNYPEAAKGRAYGSLLLSVIIRADGNVQEVLVDRSSGHKVLDEAARRIVRMASPYAPFPPDIARDTDIIEITRTWTFTTSDRLQAN
ncbi:MAG: energy transducer TonB [Rhodocyclaceae bacterium]|nr:energy transducer TonB [Rhodocyclaceae bacterium]